MRSRRGRRRTAVAIGSLLAAAFAASAPAEHSLLELVSTGPAGGNGAFGAFFEGASADGARVFFDTSESLVSADTDASQDVYERSGGQTTLVSTGPTGGNGALAATFSGASADGARVFFDTDESLVSGDTDASSDVYERSGGQTTLISTGPDGGNGAFGAGLQRRVGRRDARLHPDARVAGEHRHRHVDRRLRAFGRPDDAGLHPVATAPSTRPWSARRPTGRASSSARTSRC